MPDEGHALPVRTFILSILVMGATVCMAEAADLLQEANVDLQSTVEESQTCASLLCEAETAFDDLLDAERDLALAIDRGLWFEPTPQAQAEIRGQFLGWVLSDPQASSHLHPVGVRIRNIVILGDVRLTRPAAPVSVHIEGVRFPERTTIEGSFGELSLEGVSALEGLVISQLNAKGNVELNAIESHGPLVIDDVHLGGELRLSGRLTAPPAVASPTEKSTSPGSASTGTGSILSFRRLVVGESLVLSDLEVSTQAPTSETDGILTQLQDVLIRGDLRVQSVSLLYLRGSKEADRYDRGTVLALSRVHVGGGVIFPQGLHADGAVVFSESSIGGSLLFYDSVMMHPHAELGSLVVANTPVGGNVVLEGLRADGPVSLSSVRIGGNVLAAEATIFGTSEGSLLLDHAQVEGSVRLGPGFKSSGVVSLCGARIGGSLGCQGLFEAGGQSALLARNVHVEGDVLLGQAEEHVPPPEAEGETKKELESCGIGENVSALPNRAEYSGTVDFTGAKIDGLLSVRYVCWRDARLLLSGADVECLRGVPTTHISRNFIALWPTEGNLVLTGLTYTTLGSLDGPASESLLEWLRRQLDPDVLGEKRRIARAEAFPHQPYDHLARILSENGYPSIAREILIAKNRDIAKYAELSFPQQIWYFAFGPLIGYGYVPLRAGLLAIGLVVLGSVVFGFAHRDGYLVPTEGREKARMRRFSPLMYAVDMTLPIINFRQASHWTLNANDMRRWRLFGRPIRVVLVLRVYVWLSIAFGWLLATLLAAGLSGLLRT